MSISRATSTDVSLPTIGSVKVRPIKGPFAAVVVPLHVKTRRGTLDILSSFVDSANNACLCAMGETSSRRRCNIVSEKSFNRGSSRLHCLASVIRRLLD
jgi:hypothetical protein